MKIENLGIILYERFELRSKVYYSVVIQCYMYTLSKSKI